MRICVLIFQLSAESDDGSFWVIADKLGFICIPVEINTSYCLLPIMLEGFGFGGYI